MGYKIIISPRAQKEIIKTIDFYLERSENAPIHFVFQLEKCYLILANNPFFSVRYKNIRSIKIKKFPYSLFFTLNDKTQYIEILTCFHNKRSPRKRPKKNY